MFSLSGYTINLVVYEIKEPCANNGAQTLPPQFLHLTVQVFLCAKIYGAWIVSVDFSLYTHRVITRETIFRRDNNG